jgi:hypothetical protein
MALIEAATVLGKLLAFSDDPARGGVKMATTRISSKTTAMVVKNSR